jgi:membrane-associated phospholipid phosphatase
MAVVAAVALAGDVAIAALAVGLVMGTSGAVWFAVTRRGSRRAAGVALATLAGAGLVVVLATHWQGVLVLVALVLLLSVFGLAARYALGKAGEAAARGAAAGVVPVGAAGSAALIINLKSGGGKAERGVAGASFPSGHATQASAFWLSLVLALRAAGGPPMLTRVGVGVALLIVLTVAASRVYLGVHYPGDVVAGVLLGTGWAAYVSRCSRRPKVP